MFPAILKPDPVARLHQVERQLQQHHVDIQRLWKRQTQTPWPQVGATASGLLVPVVFGTVTTGPPTTTTTTSAPGLDCPYCGASTPTTLTVNAAGVNSGSGYCAECPGLAITWTLTKDTGQCSWRHAGPGVCSYLGVTAIVELDNMGNAILTFFQTESPNSTIASYICNGFGCSGANTFNYVSDDLTSCLWPPTMTVTANP